MKINISLCNVKPIYDFRSELENALFRFDNILEKDDVVTIDYDVAYNDVDISTQHIDNNVIYISVIFNSEDSSYVGLASLHDVEDVGYFEYVKWDTSNFPHYKDFIAQAIADYRVAYNTFSSNAIERVEVQKVNEVMIKQDADNIYTVQLGSMFINGINKNGITFKEVKAHLDDKYNKLNTRLKAGQLFGELDPVNTRCHTSPTTASIYNRDAVSISISDAVFKIVDISTVDLYTNPTEADDEKRAIVIGKIIPLNNILGRTLKAALDSPITLTTFGLRGIVNQANQVDSKLELIITWDLVTALPLLTSGDVPA